MILIWESQDGGITLVSKHTSEPKHHNSHDAILKHWNRKDGRERSPHGYSHKMFDKGVENKHGGKKNLFNNCADKNGFITTCRMKLDPFPLASTKIHSKWHKNLNITHGLFLFGDYFCVYLGFIFVLIFRISHMHLCFDRVSPPSSTLLYPPPPPLLTWCFIFCSFLFYSHWAYSLLPECMCMGIRLSYG